MLKSHKGVNKMMDAEERASPRNAESEKKVAVGVLRLYSLSTPVLKSEGGESSGS